MSDRRPFSAILALLLLSMAAVASPQNVVVTSNSNPSQVGEFVTFTATVTGIAPTGTVRFIVDGGTPTPFTPISPLSGNVSVGSWVASSLTLGNHSVVSQYVGNLGNLSSLTFGQAVLDTRTFATTTSLAASPNPSNPGESVTFTATMTSSSPPTGVVNFYAPNGSGLLTLLASQPAVVTGNFSTAGFSTSSLAIGTTQVSANFIADAPFLMSTGNRSVTVLGPAATTTLLNINPNPARVGQTVTFTSTVTSGSGTPTGSVVFTVAGTPFGPFNLTNGSVNYQTTFPSIGNFSALVAYTPTGNFLGSNSLVQPHSVIQASTTMNLISSLNPATQGDTVTFTATVNPQFLGTPTGTMNFFVDGSPVAGVTLIGGSAQFSTSSLAVGGRFIQAFYSGSSNFGSSSGSLNQTILALPPAAVVSVLSNSNPSQLNEFVTFTAEVTGAAPTGTIRFTVDGGAFTPPISLTALNANLSTASWVASALSLGNHSVLASYVGNLGNFSSAVFTQNVIQTRVFATATSLAASPNPSNPGESVTFTATMTSSSPPTGVVNFYAPNGSGLLTLLASQPAVVTGNFSTAGFSTSSLAIGTTQVSANFIADAPFLMSTGNRSVTVLGPAATTTLLNINPNPARVGQTVTFTSTVTSGSGTPTGSVVFTVAGTPFGPFNLTNGSVDYQTTFPSIGNFSALVAYTPTGNFLGSNSLVQPHSVIQASTTTNLISSLNPATQGDTVTFTATVNPQFLGTPTGTMNFFVDGSPVAGVTLAGGSAQFSTSSLAVGGRFIQAFYSGSSNFGSSSGSLNQTVLALPPAAVVSVLSNSNPSQLNEFVTFTAEVTGAAPTGTIRFTVDGGAFTPPISLTALNANLSTASWVASALSLGNHSVLASYVGNLGNFSSAVFTQNVIQTRVFATATSLAASPNPSNPGESVTFTATMTSSSPPTGVVNFYAPNGSGLLTLLASQPAVVTGNFSTAGFSTSSLAIGTTQVSANFIADAPFLMSTGNRSVTVLGPAATTTLLNINPNPARVGQTVTFTSTVTSGSGTPTGSVVFTVAGTPFGPFNLTNGSVDYQTTFPSIGNFSALVAYTPTGNFLGSNSLVQPHSVIQASTTTNLISSLNPATQGDTVTFTATVNPQFLGTPTGTMNFFVDGSPVAGVTLAGGSAQFSTSSLAVGGRFIQAFYSGSSNFGSSSGSLNQTVLALPPAAVVSVLSNSNPSQLNEFVTFTAEVTGAAPTGTIRFTVDGGAFTPPISLTALNANLSTASWVASALSLGNHSVLASYVGNLGNFSSAVFTQNVIQTRVFATATSLAASPNPSNPGESVTFTATMTSSSPPTGVVNFYAPNGSGLLTLLASQPAVVTGNFSTAGFSTSSLAIGTTQVSANFIADAPFLMSTGNRSVTVLGPAATSTLLNINPNPARVGQTVTFTSTVTSGSGTPTGSVVFTVAGTPFGPFNLTNGSVDYQTTFPSIGNFSALVAYTPTGNFLGSNSLVQPHSVIQASTTTNLISSLNPATQGDTVTFTATVNPQFLGTPTGTMNFFVDGSPVAGVTLIGGSAQFNTSSLAVGGRFIQAFYSGSSNFGSSSGSLNQTILALPPAAVVSVLSNSNPSQLNEFVTFTAEVTGAAPTGTIRFTVDGGAFTPPISLTALNANLSTASWVASALSLGNHSVLASYVGNLGNFSSATLSQFVIDTRVFTTSIVVSGAPNPASVGSSVTFTAQLTSFTSPTGVVNFYAQGGTGLLTLLGSSPATVLGGNVSTANVSTSSLPAGLNTIFANFVADTPFYMSSGNTSVTVLAAIPTNTTLSILPNPANAGQTVTFTANVTSGLGTPTGSVTFTINSLPFGPFSLSGGAASFPTSFGSNGNFSATATYAPTGLFVASNSGAQPFTIVTPPALSLTVLDATRLEPNTGLGNMTFVVTRPASGTAVTFMVTTVGGSASGGGIDYNNLVAVPFTMTAATLSRTVSVPIVGDLLDENNETLQVIFTPVTAGVTVNGLASDTRTGTITDNDTATFSITDISFNEGAGTAVFTVSQSVPSIANTSVSYLVANIQAIAGLDYATTTMGGPTGTLNFAASLTTPAPQTLTVDILDDLLDEPTETFRINLGSPVNGVVAASGGGIGIGAILDTPDAPPNMTINSVSLAEGSPSGNTTFNFTVSLSIPSGRAIPVTVTTSDVSAQQPTDYTQKIQSFNFTPGSGLTRTFAVTVKRDSVPESDETFSVSLSGVTNANVLVGTGVGTILNDDAGLQINDVSIGESGGNLLFTVTRTATSGGNVTFNYATAGGTAIGGASCAGVTDYVSTSGSGSIPASVGVATTTITVPVCNDGLSENHEILNVNLSSVVGAPLVDGTGVGTINNDDALPSGSLKISEFRYNGPNGALDQFVEVANTTAGAVTIGAQDLSSGFAVGSAGATLFVIPNGTTIPAYGHFLAVNNTGGGYSLAGYGGAGAANDDATFITTLGVDQGLALFDTAAFTGLTTPLDAVGFSGNGLQYFEGTALTPAAITPGGTANHSFVRRHLYGAGTGLQDGNDSSADWALVATDPAADPTLAAAMLGGPSPENLIAETDQSNAGLTVSGSGFVFTGVSGSTPKTLEFRRTFTNNTGGLLNAVRFKVSAITGINNPVPGQADLRPTDSPAFATFQALFLEPLPSANYVQTTPAATPYIAGTALNGGLNSSLRLLAGLPLPNFGTVDVNFRVEYTLSGMPFFYWVVPQAK